MQKVNKQARANYSVLQSKANFIFPKSTVAYSLVFSCVMSPVAAWS